MFRIFVSGLAPLILIASLALSSQVFAGPEFVLDLDGTIAGSVGARPGLNEFFEAVARFPDSKITVLSHSSPEDSSLFIELVSEQFYHSPDFLKNRFSIIFPRKSDIAKKGIEYALRTGTNPLNVVHVNDMTTEHRSGDPYAFLPVGEGVNLVIEHLANEARINTKLTTEFYRLFRSNRELLWASTVLNYVRDAFPDSGVGEPIAPKLNEILYGEPVITGDVAFMADRLKGARLVSIALLKAPGASAELHPLCHFALQTK